jgi:hypothetical protein
MHRTCPDTNSNLPEAAIKNIHLQTIAFTLLFIYL